MGMDWSCYPRALTNQEAEKVRDLVRRRCTYAEIKHPWFSQQTPDRGYMVRLWNSQTSREVYVQSLDGIDQALEEIGPYDPNRPLSRRYERWCWC